MTDDASAPANPSRHLSDEEIDAYWAGRLGDEAVRRAEQHYLECASCHVRVQTVEQVVDQLHALPEDQPAADVSPWWRLAAAVLAGACVIAGWQWWQTSERERALATSNAELRRAAAPLVAPALTVLRIVPPTRNAAEHVTLPATGGIVALDVDVGEAGGARASFEVSLRRVDTPAPLVEARRLTPSADRHIMFPVPGSLLQPGDYLVTVKGEHGFDVMMPFTVTPSP